MKKHSISFEHTDLFSNLFIDYIQQKESVKDLYAYAPRIENFSTVLEARNSFSTDRLLLHRTIEKQYDGLKLSDAVRNNIAKIKEENTFTVCTAHQLNIFTGPLYIIYKAISAIKLADQLNERFTDKHIVPVFWLGSEDHDLEEINHFSLFGTDYEWKTDQRGAVGRMDASGLKQTYDSFSDRLRNEELKELIEKHYLSASTLTEGTRGLLNALFGEKGLVVLDAVDRALKASFSDLMKRELLEQFSLEYMAEKLDYLKSNYKVQASPREINLFYLKDSIRERIVREGEEWQVLNTDITFSKDALLIELERHPERFSPNVILRPLYQELVLPNLAYLGGAGELAYWLQMKDVFMTAGIPMPILLPRDMNLIVDERSSAKWGKLGFDMNDIFKDENHLIKAFISEDIPEEYSEALGNDELEKAYDTLIKKIQTLDPALKNVSEAEKVKFLKGIAHLKAKLNKSLKNKSEVQLNQLKTLKAKFLPGNKPQERVENVLSYLDKYGLDFLNELYEAADPLDLTYAVLELVD